MPPYEYGTWGPCTVVIIDQSGLLPAVARMSRRPTTRTFQTVDKKKVEVTGMTNSTNQSCDKLKRLTVGDPQFFYSAAAIVLLVFMLIGFGNFFRSGRYPDNTELNADRRGLIIAHGIVMTLWMLLFTIQPILISKSNLRVHRMLGWFGAGLAVGVVVLGSWVWLSSFSPVESDVLGFWGNTSVASEGFGISVFAVFAGFISVGVASRKRPAVHRALMLMGTLAIMTAAFDRIPWITSLYQASPITCFGPYIGPLTFGLLFLCTKSLVTRSFDRYFAFACTAFAAVSAIAIAFAKSSVWTQIAGLISSSL